MQWGLNLPEAALFSFCYDLPSWAEHIIVNGEVFCHASKNKAIEELPILTDKPDTVYRLYKSLEEKGLIEYSKQQRKDLIRVTEKGKAWNRKNSEKNPSLETNSEKNPSKLGKKSEQNSENFPTDKNISILDNQNEREPPAPEYPKQKEEKPVIAQEIEKLIQANPKVSPAELKVFVLKEAIKDHFKKYPLNRDLYTTGLTPVPTAQEFLEQIDIYVRHYSAESVPGYQFFINDPVGHIPKTFPKWLRRWASGKRGELRRSGATSEVYEKPKI